MFQNYQSDNIKLLGTRGGSSRTATVSTAISSNSILGIFGGTNVTGYAKQMMHDGTQNNVLLTLDMRMTLFDANSRYYPFVHTYAATAPVDTIAPSIDTTLLYTLGEATDYATEAKVLIPKLDLDPDENQYIIVGYLSDNSSTGGNEITIDAKLHLEDYHVFQPSK